MARTSTSRSGSTRQDSIPGIQPIPTFPTFQPLVTAGAGTTTAIPGIAPIPGAATNPLSFIPNVNTGAASGRIPQRLLNQTATSLEGALRGELPEDVQNLLRQQAAEYGVASGAPGSQFAAYRGLRNLGLTSLDRIKGAENILAQNFTSPLQAQQLALSAGGTRAGLAQNINEQAQALALAQAKLGQEQSQFTSGQNLERDKLAQQLGIAGLQQSGENYRASLGLQGKLAGGGSGGGGGGGSGGGFSGGIYPNSGFAPDTNSVIVAQGTAPKGVNYDTGDYILNPTDYGTTSGGFENYDDVIDYYGY